MTARFSLLLRNTRGHRPRLQYHPDIRYKRGCPPVSGPNVTQSVVQTDAPRHPTCPGTVRAKGKHIRVMVTRAGLDNEPPGWLTSWAEDLEAQGCIRDGQALRLASQLAESMPLDV